MTDGLVLQRAALNSAKLPGSGSACNSRNRVRFVGVPLPGTGAWTGAMAWVSRVFWGRARAPFAGREGLFED